jgi:hypothetical protein
MSDLDTALRAMLRERANDIDALPAAIAELNGLDIVDTGRRHHSPQGRRTAWLIAAAVAAVLAVVGAAVAIRSGSATKHLSPATPSPTQHTSSPSPTPTTAHARRLITLSWFGMVRLPGYQLGSQTAQPGYRQLGIKPNDDHDLPPGCNGCAPWTAYITVFDKGRFAASGVDGWQQTSVGTARAYLGRRQWVGVHPDGDKTVVATLAWQYGSDKWVVVQGLTKATSGQQSLQHIASAVRPGESVPLRLPFRLGYLPPHLPVVFAYQDLTGQYPTQLRFGPIDPIDNGYAPMLEISVDLSTSRAVGANCAHCPVSISLTNASGLTSPASERQLARMLASITWVGAGQPGIPAEQAIP